MSDDGGTGTSRRRRVVRDSLVLLLVVGGLTLLVFRPTHEPVTGTRECPSPGVLVTIGGAAPVSCKVEPFDAGDPTSVGELQGGRPLVLNFWASWCRECLEEMPGYQQVYAAGAGRFQLVGVNVLGNLQGVEGDTRNAGRTFARRMGVRYPLAFDPDWLLFRHFASRAVLPATVFIRPDGTVAHLQFGPLPPRELAEQIRIHLGVRVAVS